MAKKQTSGGGLFEYGQMQKKEGKELKLFPSMEDLNPSLKDKKQKR